MRSMIHGMMNIHLHPFTSIDRRFLPGCQVAAGTAETALANAFGDGGALILNKTGAPQHRHGSTFNLPGYLLDGLGRISSLLFTNAGMGQNLVPLVNIKIACKWMFIPLKMAFIGIDPWPCCQTTSVSWMGYMIYDI